MMDARPFAQSQTEPVMPNEVPPPAMHVHEFEGSTMLAEECDERHNHRFAGVTSELIPLPSDHVHGFFTNTDFFDHHHEVVGLTGPAIDVGNNKHVHFVNFFTTLDDGHVHQYIFATLILSPLV